MPKLFAQRFSVLAEVESKSPLERSISFVGRELCLPNMSRSFRDLIAFQRALDLMVEVYSATTGFPPAELYGFVSQLRRASVGVMSQIAEGQGRLSLGEWRQFLSQARGSLYEVEAEALGANRLRFLSDDQLRKLERHINRTGRALNGLIEWVKKKENESANTRTRRSPRNLVTS